MADWSAFAAGIVHGGFKGYDYVKDQQERAAEVEWRKKARARQMEEWEREDALRRDSMGGPIPGTSQGATVTPGALQFHYDIPQENAEAASRYFTGKDPSFVRQYLGEMPKRQEQVPTAPTRFDGRVVAPGALGMPQRPQPVSAPSALGELPSPQPGTQFEYPVHRDEDYSLRNIDANKAYERVPANVRSYLETRAKDAGLSVNTIKQIVALESAGRTGASNSRSSADGLYQFIDDTFVDWYRASYGVTPKQMSDKQILKSKKDPLIQTDLMVRMTAAGKRAMGTDNPTALYLHHHFGPATGKVLWSAMQKHPNESLDAVVQSAGVSSAAWKKIKRANPWLQKTQTPAAMNTLLAQSLSSGSWSAGKTMLAKATKKGGKPSVTTDPVTIDGDPIVSAVPLTVAGEEMPSTDYQLAGMTPDGMWMPPEQQALQAPERPTMVADARSVPPGAPGAPQPALVPGQTAAPSLQRSAPGAPTRVAALPPRPGTQFDAPVMIDPRTGDLIPEPTRAAPSVSMPERVMGALVPSAQAEPAVRFGPSDPVAQGSVPAPTRVANTAAAPGRVTPALGGGAAPSPSFAPGEPVPQAMAAPSRQTGGVLEAPSPQAAYAQQSTPAPSGVPTPKGPGALEAPRTTAPKKGASPAPTQPARPGNPLDPVGIASVPNIAWGIVQDPAPYTRPAPPTREVPVTQPAEGVQNRDRIPPSTGLRPAPTVRGPGVPVDPRKTAGPGGALVPLQPGREELATGVNAPPPARITTPPAPRAAAAPAALATPTPGAPAAQAMAAPSRPSDPSEVYPGFSGYEGQSGYQPPAGPQMRDRGDMPVSDRKVTRADYYRHQAMVYAKHGKPTEAMKFLEQAAVTQKNEADSALFDVWRKVRLGGMTPQQASTELAAWYDQYIPDNRTGQLLVSADGIQVATYDPQDPSSVQLFPEKGKFKTIDEVFENILGMSDMQSWMQLQQLQVQRENQNINRERSAVLMDTARMNQDRTRELVAEERDIRGLRNQLLQLADAGKAGTPEYQQLERRYQLMQTGRLPSDGKKQGTGLDPKVMVNGSSDQYYRNESDPAVMPGALYRFASDGSKVPMGFDEQQARAYVNEIASAGHAGRIQIVPSWSMGQPYGFEVDGVVYDNMQEAIQAAEQGTRRRARATQQYERGLEGYGRGNPNAGGALDLGAPTNWGY